MYIKLILDLHVCLVKLTKPAGRSGAKLTADSTDGPFSLRLLEEERVGKYFHLTLCTDCSQKYLFKVKGYNVFLYKNIIIRAVESKSLEV